MKKLVLALVLAASLVGGTALPAAAFDPVNPTLPNGRPFPAPRPFDVPAADPLLVALVTASENYAGDD